MLTKVSFSSGQALRLTGLVNHEDFGGCVCGFICNSCKGHYQFCNGQIECPGAHMAHML